MFVEGKLDKRLERIKEMLLQYKKVDVGSLVSILDVSEATIRRDLERLEAEGFIKRTHGGAVLNEEYQETFPLPMQNYDEKQMIGHIASKLVDNNEVIIIGPGTTCLQFAKNLKDKKDLTIMTNNLLVPVELGRYKNINVIMTGGSVYTTEDSMSMVGNFVYKTLHDIYATKAFLGVNGVDLIAGFTGINPELALIWKTMRELAKETIVLADYTKFGNRGFVKLASLDSVHKVVTNDQVPAEYKQYFFEKGIPVYTNNELVI